MPILPAGALRVGIAAAGLRDAVQAAFQSAMAPAAGSVRFSVWDGSAAGLAGLDLGLADGPQVAALAAAGVLAAVDWARAAGDRLLPEAFGAGGIGLCLRSTALAWDRQKLGGGPQFVDFFDVARRPGRRGLQRRARGTLELALLADGVAPRDVAAALRGKDGVNRAFRKLDQLRPYVAWWEHRADPVRLLTTGAVQLTTAPAGAVSLAASGQHRDFGLAFKGSVFEVTRWVIPRESARSALAQKAVVATWDRGRQAQFAAQTGDGPLLRGTVDLLAPEQQGRSPALAANLAAALPIDDAFWAAQGAPLEARFAAWVSQ